MGSNTIKEKVVLITGAGGGLGRDIAKALAEMGGRIIVADINKKAAMQCAEILNKAGLVAEAVVLDVSDRRSVIKCANTIIKKYGRVDILVNNAGIVVGKSFLDSKDEENISTMEINAISNFWTVKAFLPGMIERGTGQIVTISSAAGLIGVPGLADYCASKFAVYGFHEAVRKEVKKKGKKDIRFTIICPYYINTGMFEGVKKSPLSFLLPLLDQKRTVKKIVKAIVKRKRRLYMPPIVYVLPLLRVFPELVFDFIATLFGVHNSMDTFKGKK
ncbi:MAG TPA: SDR family oxidoreductase [Spirochaetota bacterium]|nr:SDR family oxidoreductase [Spirochaetota bacterium]